MRPNRIFRTIGFRLAAIYAFLFAVSVAILFGVIYFTASDALHQQLARIVDAEIVSLTAGFDRGGLPHLAESVRGRTAADAGKTTYYLLLNAQGRKLAGNLPIVQPRSGWQEVPSPISRRRTVGADMADEAEHKLLARGLRLSNGAFLLVGEDTFQIVELQEAIVRAFSWAIGATALLGVLGGILISFGFLRRIDAINRTSRAIIEGRSHDRVPTRGTSDELDQLALNINEMLDRLQASMESLRQVSTDIAHDLRTPLSRLRQRLESARSGARDAADYETAVEQAIVDTDAILKTFAALLGIVQVEAGTRKAGFVAVDLSEVFRSIVDAYAAVADDKSQTMTADIEPDLRVRGDRELLTQMVANLVENAIQHLPPGGAISISLEQTRTGPIGTIADNGPGIPVDARDRVFERFFRLETSRSTPGNGLGMAQVAAIAELHGIRVELADNRPGLRVALLFPTTQIR